MGVSSRNAEDSRPKSWQEQVAGNKLLAGLIGAATCMLFVTFILSVVAVSLATRSTGKKSFPHRPAGVNVGGWLNLEDWFYSGVGGRSVSTGPDFPNGQGACLPPRLLQLEDGFRWSSEGNLTFRLLNHSDVKGDKSKVADIYMAHRRSFIGDDDLKKMSEEGIKYVRAPVNWGAFADSLAFLDNEEYGSHDPDKDAVMVMDPYYNTTHAFITTPRKWLADFIRKVGKHGMSVLLDMHAMPGGSSDGTYNGIWPNRPMFWTESVNSSDGKAVPLTEVGQRVVQGMVSWLEQLDDDALNAVRGVTIMNEPAHLSAGKDWATEEGTLAWLKEASETFRASKLPDKGVRLYMNVIETAFKDFTATVKPWFENTFTKKERSSWAVMDKHFYTAWGGGYSSGRVSDWGKYHCDDDIDDIKAALKKIMHDFAEGFKNDFPDSLRATSEFSVGTYDLAIEACKDPQVIQTFLDEQVQAYEDHDIEAYFWTWRMPYGPSFEPGWSLKYVLGLESERPNPLACLDPVPTTPSPPSNRSNTTTTTTTTTTTPAAHGFFRSLPSEAEI